MKILSHTTKNPEKRRYLIAGARKIDPAVEIDFIEPEDNVADKLEKAEIFLTYDFERDWWTGEKYLRWVHIGGSGVNHIRFPELLESGVIITNSRGIHARTMAEYTFAALLYFAQRFNLAEEWRRSRDWRHYKSEMTRASFTLRGKNLGIIGAGQIGSAIGKMGKALEMNTFGIVKSAKPQPDWADRWGGKEALEELLRWADFIVLTLPGTVDSLGLIGEREIGLMKPSAYIVNISRGGIVEEDVLIKALNEGKIAGACLDVFATEPLPEDSPLFTTKNLLITPHIAGNYPDYTIDVLDLFLENFRRYSAGETLLNLVDLKRGY